MATPVDVINAQARFDAERLELLEVSTQLLAASHASGDPMTPKGAAMYAKQLIRAVKSEMGPRPVRTVGVLEPLA
jgi:hypothetical protein